LLREPVVNYKNLPAEAEEKSQKVTLGKSASNSRIEMQNTGTNLTLPALAREYLKVIYSSE
jgi:hypothetical protein